MVNCLSKLNSPNRFTTPQDCTAAGELSDCVNSHPITTLTGLVASPAGCLLWLLAQMWGRALKEPHYSGGVYYDPVENSGGGFYHLEDVTNPLLSGSDPDHAGGALTYEFDSSLPIMDYQGATDLSDRPLATPYTDPSARHELAFNVQAFSDPNTNRFREALYTYEPETHVSNRAYLYGGGGVPTLFTKTKSHKRYGWKHVTDVNAFNFAVISHEVFLGYEEVNDLRPILPTGGGIFPHDGDIVAADCQFYFVHPTSPIDFYTWSLQSIYQTYQDVTGTPWNFGINPFDELIGRTFNDASYNSWLEWGDLWDFASWWDGDDPLPSVGVGTTRRVYVDSLKKEAGAWSKIDCLSGFILNPNNGGFSSPIPDWGQVHIKCMMRVGVAHVPDDPYAIPTYTWTDYYCYYSVEEYEHLEGGGSPQDVGYWWSEICLEQEKRSQKISAQEIDPVRQWLMTGQEKRVKTYQNSDLSVVFESEEYDIGEWKRFVYDPRTSSLYMLAQKVGHAHQILRSTDGGNTGSEVCLVETKSESLTIDSTRGKLIFVYGVPDEYSETTDGDLAVIESLDGGESWSDPIDVADASGVPWNGTAIDMRHDDRAGGATLLLLRTGEGESENTLLLKSYDGRTFVEAETGS